MNRYRFIAAEKEAGHAVQRTCRLLEVSRSAYYQWESKPSPSARQEADAQLGKRIAAIHQASKGSYGAPRVHHQLQQAGVHCGRKRVARLMADQQLMGRTKRRYRRTTLAGAESAPPAVDLLERRFAPQDYRPNQVWVGDITAIASGEGWSYLATVIDLASRKVVGYASAAHMRTELVSEALSKAIRSRRPAPGLIFHSDRGSQYTSQAYRALLAAHGIIPSLSRVGECWDNAVAESFFATLKLELLYRRHWPTRKAVQQAVFEYIEGFYNPRRLHSSLGYRSPVAYEAVTAAACPAAEAA